MVAMSQKSSRIRIIETFGALLRKKPVSKISVEEIIKQAGVSKPTFYRHFKDKFDLACRLYDYLQEPLDEAYSKDHNFRAFFTSGCNLICENKDLFASLFENPLSQNSFYQYLIDTSIRTIEQQIDQTKYTDEMRLELYRCMHGNTYIAWEITTGKLDLDFEKSINYLVDIMPDFVKAILQI